MIKLKNILAENMRRFGTKNLNEEFSDIEKLAFGGPRDPKTGNLIAPDADQNNNGYPDSTEGSADSLMILFSGTDNFMDRIAVNVFKKYGFDKTSINRLYDPNDGIVEFKVTLSNEIADKISNELERADRGLGAYGGYIIDSTEGSSNNEFISLKSSLESDLKAYDGHEITYEDDTETEEITVSIYPSERFNEIAQAVNVILEKHPLFKKTRIDRYRDEDGVTLTFDIIKK